MFRNSLKMLLTGGKSNRKNRSSGTSTENDCAFEPDYAIPPLPVTEGMQHIRIMEGMSRSLPSSPLLTHQSISVRLQPVKKLTGDAEQELGPPPSVDEAANTLMTRLGFLLGEKVTEVQPGPQYSMEVQDENQTSAGTQRISPCSTLTSSTASPPASSPCSTLPPVSTSVTAKDCTYGAVTSPTSTLESRDSGIIATLTSYSENVERTKYGGESSKELGSGGNLKPWQSQKSSMDSCLYRVDENMTASTYSLNKIPERNLETVLSQSVQSIPLYLMPRPNSVAATSSAHLEDLAYLDEQRHTPLRTSLRMPRQSVAGARTQQDLREAMLKHVVYISQPPSPAGPGPVQCAVTPASCHCSCIVPLLLHRATPWHRAPQPGAGAETRAPASCSHPLARPLPAPAVPFSSTLRASASR